MRCRKRRNVTETRLQSLAWDPAEARPAYGLGGDRHKGGVISGGVPLGLPTYGFLNGGSWYRLVVGNNSHSSNVHT